MSTPPFRFSLHSLRAQVFLWTILPLTILLIVFSLGGLSSHQQSMRTLAIQENTRLVLALAELISLQRENQMLRAQSTFAEVGTGALELEQLLRLSHPAAVNTVVLLDGEGRMLFSRGDLLDGSRVAAWPGVARGLEGESGVAFTSSSMHGDLIAYAPVPGTDWVLIIRESWHSLTAPLIRLEQVVPFVLLIAVTVSLLTLFFGLRYVARPLHELRQRAAQIGQGDFTAAARPVGGVQEIEEMRAALNAMALRVRSYQYALQDYLGAITKAQEEERSRLARELHDETTQTLIALGHRAQSAQRALARSPRECVERIAEMREMISQAIEEVRRFSRALHPHYLEELGLVAALETLAQEAGAVFKLAGIPYRLQAEKELALFRIAQEALNNARKHARARHIWLELWFDTAQVRLSVRDDGRGFEYPGELSELTRVGHFGLIGMRERAQLAGGSLCVASSPENGTQIAFMTGVLPEPGCPITSAVHET